MKEGFYMVCAFFGSNCEIDIDIQDRLYNMMEWLTCQGYTVFYSGGTGQFDLTVVRLLGRLKLKYPNISNIIVLAYLDDSYVRRYEDLANMYFAETIYPFDYTPIAKFAIVKRNMWMVDNADMVITHVINTMGGAGKILNYVKCKKKNNIELGDGFMENDKQK